MLHSSGISILDTLALPTYAASISIVILLVQFIFRPEVFRAACRKYRGEDGARALQVNDFQEATADAHHAAHVGMPVVFAFKTARLFACVLLGVLSAFTAFSGRRGQNTLEVSRWADIGLSGVYVRSYEHEKRYC